MNRGLGLSEDDNASLVRWVGKISTQYAVMPATVTKTFTEALGETIEAKKENALDAIEKGRYKAMRVFFLGHDSESSGYDGIIECVGFGIALYEGLEKVVRLHTQDNVMNVLQGLKPFMVYETCLIEIKETS